MSQNISKNRDANELFAQARAKAKTLGDVTKPLTFEEVEAIDKEVKALTLRAQILAGQTPEEEIERQGGEGDLVRVASPEESDVTPPNKQAQLEEMGKAVRAAFGGTVGYLRAARDPGRARLTAKQAKVLQHAKDLTRTIIGAANDASGGEFLLPLQQVESIFRIDNTIQGLLQRARMYSMRGRSLRIPYLIQDEEDLTRPLSGISAVQIIGEGSTKDTREPTFGERILLAFKYAAISQFSDEMLEDDMTGELDQAVIDVVGQEILNQLNFDITISGGGTTAPTGALHTSANGALLKVTRQTQNAIVFQDCVNMYTQHTHGPNSFWLVSRRAVGELFTFEVSTGSGATWLANLRSSPNGLPLLGYPIVISDFLNALGSEGDIALVNPDHYAAALRKQLTVESSIHYAFVNDITTWRFLARGGGIPIPTAPYAYRSVTSSNVNEHSPFVVLDDVYV